MGVTTSGGEWLARHICVSHLVSLRCIWHVAEMQPVFGTSTGYHQYHINLSNPRLLQIHVSAPSGFVMAQPAHGRQHHPHQDMNHQPQLQIADYAHNTTPDSDLGAMLRNPRSSALGGHQGSRHPHLASLLAGAHGQRHAGGGRLSAGSSRTNTSHDKVMLHLLGAENNLAHAVCKSFLAHST